MSEYNEFEKIKESFEDDGVYGEIPEAELQKLMENRKQRYTDGYNRPIKSNKTVKRSALIAAVVVIFIYYFTALVLNFTGKITSLTMFLMMAPVAIAALLFYFWVRKNAE